MAEKKNWTIALSVDVEEIDSQHKKLFEIANNLLNLAEASQEIFSAHIEKIIHKLSDYTQQHFTQEESFLAQHEYPSLDFHKQQHSAFIKEVKNSKRLEMLLADKTQAIALYDFLVSWLENHIAHADKAWSRYIKLVNS
ncbi:MAG: bacteriohemerythrin [Treponemataceae bacterium]